MDYSMQTEKQKRNSQESIAELIKQTREDPAMFQHIYLQWVTPVYQYIFARTGNQQDAEDITSQVFMRAFQAFPRYEHRGLFSAWLFTIVRNQVNGVLRKKKVIEVPLTAARHANAATDMLISVSQTDEINRLKKLIAELSDEDQELIRLRYIAELKFAEIGAVLGRSEAAVKKALYRLQERLKSLLEDNYE